MCSLYICHAIAWWLIASSIHRIFSSFSTHPLFPQLRSSCALCHLNARALFYSYIFLVHTYTADCSKLASVEISSLGPQTTCSSKNILLNSFVPNLTVQTFVNCLPISGGKFAAISCNTHACMDNLPRVVCACGC